MEEENHALLHELAASMKHVENTIDEIKDELKTIREFQIRVEKYIAAEKVRASSNRREIQKISVIISSLVSALVNLVTRILNV